MTGTGRAAKARPAKDAVVAEPSLPAAPSAGRESDQGEQKMLGGLSPSERLAASRMEEDLLDIPAFLRRQAN